MRFRFEPVPDFIDQFDKLTRKDRALRERAIKNISSRYLSPKKKGDGRNTGQIPSDYLALAWNFL